MSNLQLWQSVEKTDPAHTKSFTKGGGFSGTAINAVYLAKRATETFGPIGIGWGVEVMDDQYIDGAPLVADGQVVGREVIHKVLVRLWYVLDGKRGEVQHYGLTTVVGRNKHGFFTDEDHAKKSLTDATTKALSLLGFAADVHLGKYDDNKYVNDLRREFAETRQFDSSPRERELREIADELIRLHAKAEVMIETDGDTRGFWTLYETYMKVTDSEERLVIWNMLAKHSAIRSALKEYKRLDDEVKSKQREKVAA